MSCPPKVSRCNLDRRNNSWVAGDVNPQTGEGGVCLLDQLTDDEIGDVLRTNPFARMDLPKVTSDPTLLALLEKYKIRSTDWPAEVEMNQLGDPTAGPHYTVIKGRWSDFL